MPERCAYNPDHAILTAYSGPSKRLQYPDGRRLDWRTVCSECNQERMAWEQQRDIEKFQEQERRRLWHKEVRERNEARQAAMAARKHERDVARIFTLEKLLAEYTLELAHLKATINQESEK